MKFYLTCYCMMLCLSMSIGQTNFSMKTFLASASQEESVLFQDQKFNFLTTTSHRLPLIEKMEFRTNTNDFDIKLQEYSLRISPNSLRSIKKQRQYQKTVQYLTEMERNAAWGQALRERYDLLVNAIYFQEILAVRNKQKILYHDKVILLRRSIALPDFDVLNLIEAEDEAQENLREILDLENAISTFNNAIQGLDSTSNPIQIEKDKLPDINDIKRILVEIKPDEIANHPELKVLYAKVQNYMLEYQLESAKTKFSVGLIDAKYDFGPKFSLQKSFSIGLGFNLPVKGSAKLDLNELQISIFESESQYKEAKNFLMAEKYSIFQSLNNLIQKYELVNQQLNDSQAEHALKEYSKIAEASPQALLKLRENTLKKELLLQQLERDILQSFIEYLDFSGLLSQKPFKNYLSKDLEEF